MDRWRGRRLEKDGAPRLSRRARQTDPSRKNPFVTRSPAAYLIAASAERTLVSGRLYLRIFSLLNFPLARRPENA